MWSIKDPILWFQTLLSPFEKSTLRSVTGPRKVSLKSAGDCGTTAAMGFGLGFGKELDRDSIIDIHIRSTEKGIKHINGI